jgi:hypothetical protein
MQYWFVYDWVSVIKLLIVEFPDYCILHWLQAILSQRSHGVSLNDALVNRNVALKTNELDHLRPEAYGRLRKSQYQANKHKSCQHVP